MYILYPPRTYLVCMAAKSTLQEICSDYHYFTPDKVRAYAEYKRFTLDELRLAHIHCMYLPSYPYFHILTHFAGPLKKAACINAGKSTFLSACEPVNSNHCTRHTRTVLLFQYLRYLGIYTWSKSISKLAPPSPSP